MNTSGLIKIASKGFFPLFELNWTKDLISKPVKISPAVESEARVILSKLSTYTSMERKKIYLSSLPADKRRRFISYFISRVECYAKSNCSKFQ